MRAAIAALVNRILEVRSPEICRNTSTCTSDGKYLGAWEQNLVAQWNPHYNECGIMSYFLVDENSAGRHSQVRRGTEVAAMITSLIRHDTMMTVEANCIDSHGQSELGVAFVYMVAGEISGLFTRLFYWSRFSRHGEQVDTLFFGENLNVPGKKAAGEQVS